MQDFLKKFMEIMINFLKRNFGKKLQEKSAQISESKDFYDYDLKSNSTLKANFKNSQITKKRLANPIFKPFYNHNFAHYLFHQKNFDDRTFSAIRKITSHQKISRSLQLLCYLIIIAGILIYIASFFEKTKNIKIISDIKNKSQLLEVEKIMINPRIIIKNDDESSYLVKAKIARHLNSQNIQLEEVFAEGKIGRISAGDLKIEDEGNHLIFSKNPILILNQQ
jgi:hypothetical protein